MVRTICFIDKDGFSGVCSEEGLGKNTIDCHKCPFYKEFKGREAEEFSYCAWLGDLALWKELKKEVE